RVPSAGLYILSSLRHLSLSQKVCIARAEARRFTRSLHLPSSSSTPILFKPAPYQVRDLGLTLASVQTFGTVKEDISYAPEHIEEDDFEEISYDELRLSLCSADPAHFVSLFEYQRSSNSSLLSRSRSSISRLRSLSRASLKRPRGGSVRTRAKDAQSTFGSTSRERTPSLGHSRPSTSGGSSSSSSTPHTPPTHTASLSCFEADNLDKSCSRPQGEHSQTSDESTVEAHSSALVPVPASPRSPKTKSFASSLRRLRTLSKSSLFSARKHATQVCQAVPAESSGASPHLSTLTAAEAPVQLPELVFEQVDFTCLATEDDSTLPIQLTSIAADDPSPAPQDPPLPRLEIIEASPRLHIASLELPRFEFVDPRSLTASAPASAVDRISRFWSTPPSPSWLSRNVVDIEPAPSANSPPPLPIPPPPSPPLYIVPRSLRPDSYYLREPEVCFKSHFISPF
ncbi:hypothetical protein FKP32DRAFT_1655854, partial [Trametes sanguinea]